MTLTLEEEVKVPFAFDYRLLAEEVVLAALTTASDRRPHGCSFVSLNQLFCARGFC